jgi:hypothetical protein
LSSVRDAQHQHCHRVVNARPERKGPAAARSRVLLKPGADGKASIVVAGQGERLTTPSLALNVPLVVQLQSDTGVCWEARYAAGGVKRNDMKAFEGRAP